MKFNELKDRKNREIINQNLEKLVRLETQVWLDLGIEIKEEYIADMCSLMVEIFNHYAEGKLDPFYCFTLYNTKRTNRIIGTLWFYGLLYTREKDLELDITSKTFKYLMTGELCH